MKNVIDEKADCYGCTMCKNICPSGAIVMKPDREGFLYPFIEQESCIDCKLCQRVCPHYTLKTQKSNFEQKYYAAQYQNKDILLCSSSGGIFTALAEEILKNDGIVYGAFFDDDFVVKHGRCDNIDDLNKFCGSKYVQSQIEHVIESVFQDLINGKVVLFVGTPCQIHSIKNYLNIKKQPLDNLLLCDFICHGVSSPLIWSEYINFLQEKYGLLLKYNFRGKRKGWHRSFPEIILEKEDLSICYSNKNSYLKIYKSCNIDRLSCYNCKYTTYNRESDITLGDFWNIDKVYPRMDDDMGVSQVLINTETGEKWFNLCKNKVFYRECRKEDVWQPHLQYPIKSPKTRDKFWNDFYKNDFCSVAKKYGKDSFSLRCRNLAMPLIKKMGLYVLAGKLYNFIFGRK